MNDSLKYAAQKMDAALKAAERLAWEVGCETVDGVNTLLEDERGDLWREIVEARNTYSQALANEAAPR